MTTIIMSLGTMSQAEADRQMDAIKKIMAERKLDYGPAIDYYINNKRSHDAFIKHREKDGWSE